MHWVTANVVTDFGYDWTMETEELVEILDGMVMRYGPPSDEVKLVTVHNYFSWSVQYEIYPPRRPADELARRTGQDFGFDAAAWRRWLAENEKKEEEASEEGGESTETGSG